MPTSDLVDTYCKLIDIKAESSSNEKITLLKEYLHDDTFKTVVDLALSHDKVYKTKSFGEYDPNSEGGSTQEIFDYLIWMTKQSGIKKVEKEKLRQLASVNEETFYIVQCILAKNLRCGADTGLINNAVPDTVFTVPYMRCMSEKVGLKRIHYPAFCQKKADGGFSYGMIDRGTNKPYLMTRNGHEIILHNRFDSDIERLRFNDEVITMELTAVDSNGFDLPRELGNGLITKALRGTINSQEARLIRGQAWDLVPQDDFWKEYYDKKYLLRWNRLMLLSKPMQLISLIQSCLVDSEEGAREFFLMMRRERLEGAILKNIDGPWKDYTSPDQCKLKRKNCAEFRITGWYYGEAGKKFEKCLGGLHFESEDGKVKCNTGSGFTEKDRGFLGLDKNGIPIIDETTLQKWTETIDSIISVEFDSLITDKKRKNDIMSLFLPIFDKIRPDKNEADDLKYLQSL